MYSVRYTVYCVQCCRCISLPAENASGGYSRRPIIFFFRRPAGLYPSHVDVINLFLSHYHCRVIIPLVGYHFSTRSGSKSRHFLLKKNTKMSFRTFKISIRAFRNSFFCVHAFDQHYLSIPQYTGSWGNRFPETHGISFDHFHEILV